MTIMTKHVAQERRWPEEGFTRAPFWIYSDPDIFAREMEVFHEGPTWNYVGLECEVPKPGSYKRGWIGVKPVIITRDEQGGVHVLENRCAHRGSLVCWKNKGEAKDLTCPYHQWTYGLNGDLQGVPFMRGANGNPGMPAEFKKAEHGLGKLRTTIRNGAIWATFSDKAPNFEEYCGPEILAQLDRTLSGKQLRLIGYSRQLIPCNWKMYFENTRDPYHATLLHTYLITFGLYRADRNVQCIPTKNGHEIIASQYIPGEARQVDGQSAEEMKALRPNLKLHDNELVVSRDEFGDNTISSLQLFPSVLFQQHVNAFAMRHVIPKTPQTHEVSWTYFGYADDDEELQRLRLKHGNLLGPAGFVGMDDSEVLAQMQTVISSYPDGMQMVEMGGRDIAPHNGMITENLLRAFYKFYREAMGL